MKKRIRNYFEVKNDAIIDYIFKSEVYNTDLEVNYFLLEQINFFLFGEPIKIEEEDKSYRIYFNDLPIEDRKDLLDGSIETCEQLARYIKGESDEIKKIVEDLKGKRNLVNASELKQSKKIH